MELSSDVLVLLGKCARMNCIYEGQSFSRKAFANAFGEVDRSELAVKEMVERGLVVKSPTGAYSLTSTGADEVKSAAAAEKQRVKPKRHFEGRPPINRL